MKAKNLPPSKAAGASLPAILLLALPALALIPNFFIVPDLSHEGLATQEVVLSIAAAVLAGAGAFEIARKGAGRIELGRDEALLLGSLALFLVWRAITLAWAPSFASGARTTGVWLCFSVFLTVGGVALRRRSAAWLQHGLTLVTAILAVSLLYERWIYGDAMLGIFFNHGITAELLATLLPLQALRYLCSEKRGPAILSFAVSMGALLALLIGMRRGAIAAATVALTLIAVAVLTKRIQIPDRRRLAVLLALFLLGGGALGIRYRNEVVLRLQGATRIDAAEGGLRTRLRGWITAWEMGKRHALVGVGDGGYPSLYGEYRKYFASNPAYAGVPKDEDGEYFNEIHSPLVHNEYLEIWVELGAVGLALFAAFTLLLCRALWRGRSSPWALGSLLGLLAFGISSFTSGFSLRYSPAAFIVGSLAALGLALTREERETPGTTLPLPRPAAIAVAALAALACVALLVRNYNVYASEQAQGRPHAAAPPLDFNFYPNNAPANEALARRYEQVLQIDAESVGAHLGYGLLLFQMEQPDKAIPKIEYALRHGYGRPFTYVLLAFACEQTGDLARAAAILRDCLASYPDTIYARAAYAEILRKQGDVARRQEELKRLDGREAKSWELALTMHLEQAQAEAVRRNLLRPDQLQPRFASALVGARAMHYLK